MTALTKQNGKNDQIFLCPKVEVGARAGAQAEWMQNDLIEEGKSGILLCLRLPAPPLIPFWATRHYLHAYPNYSVSYE